MWFSLSLLPKLFGDLPRASGVVVSEDLVSNRERRLRTPEDDRVSDDMAVLEEVISIFQISF